jgi:hypothetical protein
MFNFMGKKEKKSRKGLSTSFANGNGEEIDSNLEEVNILIKDMITVKDNVYVDHVNSKQNNSLFVR